MIDQADLEEKMRNRKKEPVVVIKNLKNGGFAARRVTYIGRIASLTGRNTYGVKYKLLRHDHFKSYD